jgi:hypothetical protein
MRLGRPQEVSMRVRPLTLVIAIFLGGLGNAEAATLRTPFVDVGPGQFQRLQVTNLGKKPMTVTATFTNTLGQSEQTGDECSPAPLAPGKSCIVQIGESTDGFCTLVTSSGKVRAAVNVMNVNGTLVTVVPATK